jgi:PAS domain S-box-containing protein
MDLSWLSRRIWVVTIVGVCAVAGLLTVWRFMAHVPPLPRGPLRIGFESNPPIQIRTASGFSGISVETVSEAAKRAGIQLQWIETGTSSEEAFRKGLVDLWPLMVDLPERRKLVHIARPWVPSGFVLLHRADTPSIDRGFRGRIAVFKLPLNVRVSHEGFPNAQIVQISPIPDVIKAVCTGQSAAAFLETRVAQSQLRETPPECSLTELHLQTVPNLRLRAGLASTFEMAAAADRIQDEIDKMFRDGTLALLIAKYSYFGLDDTYASYERTAQEQRWRWITLVACGLILAAGVVLWLASSLRQRKRSEAALRESEERLALAQNAARMGVWDCDLRTNITIFSGQYARLHGFQPDHPPLPHEEWLQLVHPSDRERVEMMLRKSIEDTHSWDAEFRVVWPDGSTHWLLGKGEVFLDDSGEAVRMAGVNLDITERKQAEARLRESEERFRRVFEEGPLGVALVARDYRLLKVNNALCRMVGYSEEELTQKTFADITHPDDVRADVRQAERLFRGEIPSFRMQKRYVKKTGEIIWINLTASIIHGPDDAPLHGLAMVEDITEIKRTQEEALVRQKLESVGTLAGGIAHDFNNLLATVLVQAELAQAELRAGLIPEGELKTIRDVAMRGAEIVRELMIYAGKESRVPDVVSVSEVVEGMRELLKVSISKHATLETDLDRRLPAVRASAAQISQLVMNLGTNASEAIGDRDGVIRITTQCLPDGQGFPEKEQLTERECVQLEVSDTGCGMTPKMQARVFDPFFSSKSPGRGLGLAVVHGIVRSLGGTIHLTSEPGHGTTFQILLPCAEGMGVATEKHVLSAEPPFSTQKCTVMVVEDEQPLREGVVKMLRRNEFEVIEAADGATAIDLLRVHGTKVDVILLDLTIPGRSSHDVVTEAAEVRPDIRVIMTSAYSEAMVMDKMRAPQIRGFIRKPFRLGDVVRTLRNSLS